MDSWRAETLGGARFQDPPIVRVLLANARFAWLWLPLRVFLGWMWLDAGWHRAQALVARSGDASLADLIALGQTLAGIALILGLMTGLAAFAGGVVGAGSFATDGAPPAALLFAVAVWLVLAWKTVGWIGLDRWLLPLLGMPWRSGALLERPPATNGAERWG